MPWGRGLRVLVVGDLMVDVLSEGEVHRLSPEAPAPVVLQRNRSHTPGGAGNAAMNLAGLGETVLLMAAVGNDAEGVLVKDLLADHGVDTRSVMVTSSVTTQKHRVMAGGRQLVRLDVEGDPPNMALESVRDLVRSVDVVLLSDYAKGVCTAELCREVIAGAQNAGIPVVVDPKGADYERYRGASLITPNLGELRAATHSSSMEDQARELVNRLACAVLVTRGADGMTLFDGQAPPYHLPAQAPIVCDVTGAGDTVAAVMAACLARQMPIRQACQVANVCAGVVVGRRGTSTISLDELTLPVRDAGWPGIPWEYGRSAHERPR